MSQSQYATTTELQQLAITPAAGVRFGSTAMDAHLQAASSIADSYIASQFELPLVTDPQGWDMSLTVAVCNIAAYRLYSQFGFNPNGQNADEWIVQRYRDAILWLEQIRDKKIFPQWSDSGSGPTEQEAGPYVDSDIPVGFTSRGSERIPGLEDE